jgi:AsmA protein
LLKDAGSAGMIDSRGRLVLDLKGRGLSERQIVESLGGTVQVTLGPGAIQGFSLEKALQGLSQGRMPSNTVTPGDKTPFNDAAISFQITNGIAESKDLRLTSPLGSATGAGRVDLPKRQIDYMVRPRLAPGAGGIKIAVPGVNTQVALQAVEIPVRIRGDFDKPDIVPEFGGLARGAVADALKDPNRALETAREKLKGVDQKAAGDALKGAISGDSADRKKARDVLRGILK